MTSRAPGDSWRRRVFDAREHVEFQAIETRPDGVKVIHDGVSGMSGGEGQELPKTINEKAEQDARAYIRSLARQRGRNAEKAEAAVAKSVSYTETEAKDAGLIELIARDVPDLLKQLEGRTVTRVGGATTTLRVAGSRIETREMSRIEKLIGFVSHPNVAYLLFMAGLDTVASVLRLIVKGFAEDTAKRREFTALMEQPDKVMPAIEELVRFHAIVPVPRRVTRALEFQGLQFAENETRVQPVHRQMHEPPSMTAALAPELGAQRVNVRAVEARARLNALFKLAFFALVALAVTITARHVMTNLLDVDEGMTERVPRR